jgi:hypothetical protein
MNHRPPPWPETPPRSRCSWCGLMAVCRRVRKPKQVEQQGRPAIIYVFVTMCEVCLYNVEVM